ncbi:MAG: hypothetical protein HC796_01295 [Synechococcaceae cyanobacterium RL_1_2]|nr:hypothetical protein [Synechococcaceae cyanobacterium RL_1_2]
MLRLFSIVLVLIFSFTITGCSDRLQASTPVNPDLPENIKADHRMVEVAPPKIIQELSSAFYYNRPQVKIVSPQPDQLLQDTKVEVKLSVKDLTLFKNETFGLGPHLHLFLDNEPYVPVYNPDETVTFEDLKPGTHTLRAFASRPWHESFKNAGAFAETQFHVITKTETNNPDPALPLLTYSRPTGNYGAEPIMVDFYLTNAPLHSIAQADSQDGVNDWRVRVTINGQKFVLDAWEPIYLKGFNEGKNWVQLEYIDEQGQVIDNAFNSTVRVINYTPGGVDPLSQLMRDDIPLEQVQGIVDPTYVPPIAPELEIEEQQGEPEGLVELNDPDLTQEEPDLDLDSDLNSLDRELDGDRIDASMPLWEEELEKPQNQEVFSSEPEGNGLEQERTPATIEDQILTPDLNQQVLELQEESSLDVPAQAELNLETEDQDGAEDAPMDSDDIPQIRKVLEPNQEQHEPIASPSQENDNVTPLGLAPQTMDSRSQPPELIPELVLEPLSNNEEIITKPAELSTQSSPGSVIMEAGQGADLNSISDPSYLE